MTSDFLHMHKIPGEVARSPGSPWIIIPAGRRHRRHRVRRQKGGWQGWRTSQATEVAIQTTTPQPISLECQLPREQWLQTTANNYVKDACILLITET